MSAAIKADALGPVSDMSPDDLVTLLIKVAAGERLERGVDARLIGARLAHWKGSALALTAEGRAILEGAKVSAATNPLCLEIGDLRAQLRAAVARAEVAELRAAYWRAFSEYETYRGVMGTIISCPGSREASKRADAALSALRARGEEP